MKVNITLMCKEAGIISNFLNKYYNKKIKLENQLNWNKSFEDPIEIVDFIGVLIDNNEKFNINIWICLDNNVYIKVTEKNLNLLIKYIYERYPSN